MKYIKWLKRPSLWLQTWILYPYLTDLHHVVCLTFFFCFNLIQIGTSTSLWWGVPCDFQVWRALVANHLGCVVWTKNLFKNIKCIQLCVVFMSKESNISFCMHSPKNMQIKHNVNIKRCTYYVQRYKSHANIYNNIFLSHFYDTHLATTKGWFLTVQKTKIDSRRFNHFHVILSNESFQFFISDALEYLM